MSDTNRLIDVETKVSYQEKIINELSDVIFEQQKTIDKLTLGIEDLKSRLLELSEILPVTGVPANDKPPHY